MEPQNPAAPAFENARNAAEAERQRRIAALSPDERAEFQKLSQQHAAREAGLRETQKVHEREQLPPRMQRHLMETMKLEYRPATSVFLPRNALDLRKNIEDYIVGHSTVATKMFQHQLETARAKARSDIAREQYRERGEMRRAHRDEREAFLTRCERKRGKADQCSRNARDITQPGASLQFQKAARDPSWKRAFEKAVRQESEGKQFEQDHELGRDTGHNR